MQGNTALLSDSSAIATAIFPDSKNIQENTAQLNGSGPANSNNPAICLAIFSMQVRILMPNSDAKSNAHAAAGINFRFCYVCSVPRVHRGCIRRCAMVSLHTQFNVNVCHWQCQHQ